jgi:hypothetical protein
MTQASTPGLFDPTVNVTIGQKSWPALMVLGFGFLMMFGMPWFGLPMVICGALMLMNSKNGLTLDSHGFEYSHLFGKKRHAWSEIKEFVMVSQKMYIFITVNKFVGFNMNKPKVAAAAWFTRTFAAAERYLPTGYAVKTEELLVAMEMRRQFAASGASQFVPAGQAELSYGAPVDRSPQPRQSNWADGATERFARQAQPAGQTFGNSGYSNTGLTPPSGGFGRRQSPFPASSKKQWPDY